MICRRQRLLQLKNKITKLKVHISPLNKTFSVKKGTPLIDVVHEYGIEFPCGGKGTCGACKIKLLEGNIEKTPEHEAFLRKQNLQNDWRLACMSSVTEDITLELSQFESIILADESSFKFQASEGYGIAVDIGTTTIVAQLIDLKTSKVKAVESIMNPQARFGADIMSRIAHAADKKGAKELRKTIRKAFKELVLTLTNQGEVIPKKITVVGNTIMHHLFGGINVKPLGIFPFETAHNTALFYTPSELKLPFGEHCKIVFYPNLGSFVGSDILAGILASNMHKKSKLTALIDLGTNGEIVLGNNEKLVFASTAAGPAFEGTNISMGMKATSGAVSSISTNGEVSYHVIGNKKAKGICGSGLIDAVKMLLDKEIIDMSGTMLNNSDKYPLIDSVSISAKDIQEFQLAKAAIAAGLEILSQKMGKTINDIEEIYIAGGFGNFVNIQNVIDLGMVNLPIEKFRKLGNTALIGAKMLLFQNNEEVEQILRISQHVSLEKENDFQDIFTENMFF